MADLIHLTPLNQTNCTVPLSSKAVTKSLGNGENCSKSWNIGNSMAIEMGHSNNLMGMQPNQAKFLGHSVGLELDETYPGLHLATDGH